MMLASLFLATAALSPQGADKIAFFEKEVRPVLSKHCYRCHSQRAKKLKGGLLLDSYEGWMNGGDSGEVILPGNSEGSLLMQAVRRQHGELKMPPKDALPQSAIEALHRWIEMGAPDPRLPKAGQVVRSGAVAPESTSPRKMDIEAGRNFWSFQPLGQARPPAVEDKQWPRDEIDRFVRARQEAAGLDPVPAADRETLIRRASFDLRGLPPTLEEVEAFKADRSPQAFSLLVDRLLASEQFGERWGRHWLDIVRYAESTGRTRNYPFPVAWRYRDYVIDAFNKDLPYDRFVAEQVAGDLLPKADDREGRNAQLTATGFLAIGSKDLNERDKTQYLMDQADDQIDVMGRSIMALTLGCARCHDHKFDPISTRDYYALAGIFSSTRLLDGVANRGAAKGGYGQGSRFHRLETGEVKADMTIVAAREEAAKASAGRERLARAQAELKRMNQEFAGTKSKTATVVKEFKASRVKLQREVAQLKKSAAAQKKGKNSAPKLVGNEAMGVCDSSRPVDAKLCIRGDVHNTGEVVPRGFPEVLDFAGAAQIGSGQSGRQQLAQWLTHPDNPLTARVMVNRIWHHLFGRGLVRTVDNFGKSGEPPTHPALLDHLARRFIAQGWSVKKMIREIMLSRTYQLSSERSQRSMEIDGDNELLWRMSPRRLEVEAIRDAILAVSGQLDLQPPKGSPVTKLKGEQRPKAGAYPGASELARHRSVYLPIVRNNLPSMLRTFDFAEPSTVTGRRDVTTVATQALFMMNSSFVAEHSRHAADRLLKASVQSDEARAELAYRLALGRAPSAAETERAARYVQEFTATVEPQAPAKRKDPKRGVSRTGPGAAWANFFQAIFAGAEFRYVR